MDISNNQRQLFGAIQRAYLRDGKPIEDGVRLMNYTDRVNLNSYANYPHEINNQLDMATHLGVFGKENSQPSKLPEPLINCTPRYNETSSRFNYAIDTCIDNKLTDVSGIDIPNNRLRILPNRGTQLCYQRSNIPINKPIQEIAERLAGITANQTTDKNLLQFKASRQRLTREELLGVNRVQPQREIQPVRIDGL